MKRESEGGAFHSSYCNTRKRAGSKQAWLVVVSGAGNDVIIMAAAVAAAAGPAAAALRLFHHHHHPVRLSCLSPPSPFTSSNFYPSPMRNLLVCLLVCLLLLSSSLASSLQSLSLSVLPLLFSTYILPSFPPPRPSQLAPP